MEKNPTDETSSLSVRGELAEPSSDSEMIPSGGKSVDTGQRSEGSDQTAPRRGTFSREDFDPFHVCFSDEDLVSRARSGKMSVAVISDSESCLNAIKEILEPNGLKVVTHEDGRPGEEFLPDAKPNLVIADLDSTAFDDVALVRRVHQIDPSVPLIMTAFPDKWDRVVQSARAGAFDFVPKPLNGEALLWAIRRALQYGTLVKAHQAQRLTAQAMLDETVEISRRRDFLQGILDSSTKMSIVLTDLDQVVRFWNTGAENLFGYTADEMIGTKITKLYPEDSLSEETVEELRKMVRTKSGTVHGKMKQLAKDGRELTVSLALSPMLDASGVEFQGILGVGLDITEEVRRQSEILRLLDEVRNTQDVTIFSLAKLAEDRDEETGAHLQRMQEYTRITAEHLAKREDYRELVTPRYIDDLVRTSVLHDIGKVGVPDSILLSTERYTPEQFEIMKRHTIIGGKALEEAVRKLGRESFLSIGMDVAYSHHEKWDGSGYPFGHKAEQIPLAARIVALADVYDALTTERRYKRAFSHEETRSIVVEGKGKHFDPVLVDVFLEAEAEFKAVRRADSE